QCRRIGADVRHLGQSANHDRLNHHDVGGRDPRLRHCPDGGLRRRQGESVIEDTGSCTRGGVAGYWKKKRNGQGIWRSVRHLAYSLRRGMGQRHRILRGGGLMEYSSARQVTLSSARKAVPTQDGKPFAELFHHGSLEIEIYAPRGTDAQKPHSRDEVY